MKKFEFYPNKTAEVTINTASKEFAGYGHYKLIVELVDCETRQSKIFSHTTTDMEFVNSINDMNSADRENAIFDHIETEIEEAVNNWLYELHG